MESVFEWSNIKSIKIKNRIIRSATHEGLADEYGRPTEKMIKKYEALAKGEVGCIITGHMGIMQNGKSDLHNMTMIDNNDLIPYHKELVSRVHGLDTSIIAQISHCGRQTNSSATGFKTVAPSAIKDKHYNGDTPHELNEEEILDIVKRFVDGIVRVKRAGYDGVQLHLAHGYLLSSFLSPHMNRRRDKWGGNTENRFRIIKEIFLLAKESVGDYPILVKMNAYEKSADGLKIDEAVKIAEYLEKVGCAAIEVSCGIIEDGLFTIRGEFPFDMLIKNHEKIKKVPRIVHAPLKGFLKKRLGSPKPYFLYNLESAERIKMNINIPVILVGGIRNIREIESIVSDKGIDYVSMCRPLIMEPNLVKKFKEGKQKEAKCINCNYCVIGDDTGGMKCYYGKC